MQLWVSRKVADWEWRVNELQFGGILTCKPLLLRYVLRNVVEVERFVMWMYLYNLFLTLPLLKYSENMAEVSFKFG